MRIYRGFTPSLSAILLGSAVLVGCSSVNLPEGMHSQAKALISQAETSGAREEAPSLLRTAEKNLSEAEMAMSKEQAKPAKIYLERAIADAELALAKTSAAKAEDAAKEIRESIEMIERETITSRSYE